jgi:hypothetical protein
VAGGAFLWDAKPPGLDIQWTVDRLDTCVTEFYMEYIVFTRTCLLYVRVIMVFVHISLVKLPFQTVMEWIPTLEFALSGARGLLLPDSFSPGN